MNVFVTGATGYMGGSVAVRLVADGHQVRSLTRDPAKVPALSEAGIDAVVGALDDAGILARGTRYAVRGTRNADAVVNAADADHHAAVEAIFGAAKGTSKVVVHMIYWVTRTAGSAVRYYRNASLSVGDPSARVTVPTAFSIHPRNIPPAPPEFAERFFDVVRWTNQPRGATPERGRNWNCSRLTSGRTSMQSSSGGATGIDRTYRVLWRLEQPGDDPQTPVRSEIRGALSRTANRALSATRELPGDWLTKHFHEYRKVSPPSTPTVTNVPTQCSKPSNGHSWG